MQMGFRRLFLAAMATVALAIGGASASAQTGDKVNLNAASPGDLAKVPGFDPNIAARIAARRAAKGPFTSFDQLLEIQGVTKMTLVTAIDHLDLGPAPVVPAAAPAKKLDLNKATFKDLLLLPEMTARTTKAILDYREKNGPFKSLDELGNIPGLDKKTVLQLLDQVTVVAPAGGGTAVAKGGDGDTATLGDNGWTGSWVNKIEAQPSAAATPTPEPLAQGEKIDINTAERAELERLPDIGPVMAQRIVEYRTANGPFKDVDSLRDVRGIGVQRITELRPYVTVASTAAAAPKPTPHATVRLAKATPRPTPVARATDPPVAATPKPTPTTVAMASHARPSAAITPDGRVNINVADVDDLLTLPRMTRDVAEEIVSYRSKNGPFKDPHGITMVPSIGEATYARLREKIIVK